MKARLLAVAIALALIPASHEPAIAGGVSSSGQVAADLHGAGLLSSQQIEEQYQAELWQIWTDFGIVAASNVAKAYLIIQTGGATLIPSGILYVVGTGASLARTETGLVPERPFEVRLLAPWLPFGSTVGWDVYQVLK